MRNWTNCENQRTSPEEAWTGRNLQSIIFELGCKCYFYVDQNTSDNMRSNECVHHRKKGASCFLNIVIFNTTNILELQTIDDRMK